MKKSILILFSLFSFSFAFAQSGYNLEFSQAILIENGNTMTVPSGKVWKVVSVLASNTNSPQKKVIINGTSSYIGKPGEIPLWLPAGTTIRPDTYSSITTEFISVVEFNLISN